MNHESPADWNELTKLWQAESAAISIGEIERYIQRERARLRALAGAEFAGLGLGVLLALWAGWSTPFIWFSAGFLVFCLFTAWFARAERGGATQAEAGELLASLRIGIEREQELVTRLGIGRLLSFVALGGVLFLLSRSLVAQVAREGWLLVLFAAALWLCTAIAWNLVLTGRARRRRRRLEEFAAQLKGAA